MQKLKKLFASTFESFTYFYRHLRYRLFVIFLLSVLVGAMDGFGLAMFLPLLQMVSGEGGASTPEQMGNLSFLVKAIDYLGLSLTLSVVLYTMLFFFILKGFFKFLEQYKKVVYRQFFIRNIREKCIRLLARYSYYNFVTADAGRIQNTMTGEISRVGQGFANYMMVLQYMVLLIVYSILAFLANPQFALLVAVGGILTNLLFTQLYKKTKRLSRELTASNHGFQGLIIQQVHQFKYLKATGLIRFYAKKLVQKVYLIEDTLRKIGILNSIVQGVREPLMIAVVVFVILIQINLLGGSLGLIILSILFFYRALTAVMQVQTAWNKYLELSGSLENINDFTNELRQGKEDRGSKPFKKFTTQIKLQNLSFSYDSTPIVQNINLEIYKNETIAFVGESGSGKTTLLNLISGLLKPDSGYITIDGQRNTDLKITDYQKRIGYITQEPVIFNDTVFNNVTFWAEKNNYTLCRFQEVLKQAQICQFIQDQPEKEDTVLGNNGVNLSGGQKQRISIARELYKDVDFLFLDEATSALDSETEKQIQNSFDNLKGQYTIIIIAHRLSTIKSADRVVMMNKGMIEQIGTFQDLIKQSSTFKRMVELQEV